MQRLMTRNKLSREEAESRINSQMPLMEKRRMATFVIDNSGTEEMMEKQIVDVYKKFRRSRAHWPLRIVGWASIAVLFWISWMILRAVL